MNNESINNANNTGDESGVLHHSDKVCTSYVLNYKGYHDIVITPDDMPNDLFRDIADLCGVDVAVKILLNFKGNTIPVPIYGMEKVEKKIILKEHNNDPFAIKILARKLEMSEVHIRKIIKRFGLTPAEDGQQKLFDKATLSYMTRGQGYVPQPFSNRDKRRGKA